MYLDPQTSLALYKVNLKFYFRLCDLARENLLRWSEAGNRSLDTTAAELETGATRMLDAADWRTMGFVASDLFWRSLQLQANAMQHMAETVLSSQGATASAVQEAISAWQKDSAAALKETAGAMPISTSMQDYLENYLHVLAPASGLAMRLGASERKLH